MPRAKVSFGTVCMLSAAMATAGCTTSHKPAPEKADAAVPGVPVNRANKADLVGCWTDMHWVDSPDIETGRSSEKTQVGSTICFDGEIYHSITVWLVDAMGDIGHYKLTSSGALELTTYSREWFSYRMKISFRSRNEISGKYFLDKDESSEPFLLRRDPSNKTYLKLKDVYKNWMRDAGAPDLNKAG